MTDLEGKQLQQPATVFVHKKATATVKCLRRNKKRTLFSVPIEDHILQTQNMAFIGTTTTGLSLVDRELYTTAYPRARHSDSGATLG